MKFLINLISKLLNKSIRRKLTVFGVAVSVNWSFDQEGVSFFDYFPISGVVGHFFLWSQDFFEFHALFGSNGSLIRSRNLNQLIFNSRSRYWLCILSFKLSSLKLLICVLLQLGILLLWRLFAFGLELHFAVLSNIFNYNVFVVLR